MPESKKPTAEQKPAATSRDLTPAAESSDPAVQQLLAERGAAVRNGDDAAAEAVAEQLAKLGYK